MIRGIEVFKKFFEGYKDQYVLIGGAYTGIRKGFLEIYQGGRIPE